MKKNNYKYLTLCFIPLATIPLIATISCGTTCVTLTGYKYGNVNYWKDVNTDLYKIVYEDTEPTSNVICYSSTTIYVKISKPSAEDNFITETTTLLLLNDSQFAGISDYNDDLSKLQYVIGLADVIPKLCYLTNYNGTEIYPVEPPETAGDKIEVKSNYFSMIIPYSYVGTDTFNCYLLSYTFNSNETDKTKFSCIPTSSKFIVSLENN